MASTTSDSLPSSPSLPGTGTGTDQEFSSIDHHSLFLPSSSSPASLYLDHDSSSFHGFFPTSPPPTCPHAGDGSSTSPAGAVKAAQEATQSLPPPPTTVLTTDTSNFRAMVQEFTGFPAPPFAAGPPPSVRPRLLGGAPAYGPPFLLRPSPLKYPQHNSALLPSMPTCTTTATLANAATTSGSANSLMDALALFARSNAMPIAAAAATTASGSGTADQYGSGHHGHGMGAFNFNPFDDFEAAAAEGEKAANGGHAGFFSSLGGSAGDKYDRH